MSRMIDDEEELKDYELIEKCSNLVTDENKCLDTWDDENADYKECKRINCHKKQLKRLEAENEKLKNRNKLYKKIIKENIEKANNNFMILTACIQGNLTVDEVKEYAKLNAKNEELKRKIKPYKQALEDIKKSCNTYAKTGDYVIDQTFNEFLENVFNKINEVLNK